MTQYGLRISGAVGDLAVAAEQQGCNRVNGWQTDRGSFAGVKRRRRRGTGLPRLRGELYRARLPNNNNSLNPVESIEWPIERRFRMQ